MQGDGVVAQPLVAVVGDQVVVLDADAADAGDVQAGLQRDHVAGQQRLVGLADEERRFGVRQAQAVAGVVGEVLGHARLLEDAAHGC